MAGLLADEESRSRGPGGETASGEGPEEEDVPEAEGCESEAESTGSLHQEVEENAGENQEECAEEGGEETTKSE